jgi:hypothetical protein
MAVVCHESEDTVHFQECNFFQRERIENTKLFFESGKEYCDYLIVKMLLFVRFAENNKYVSLIGV